MTTMLAPRPGPLVGLHRGWKGQFEGTRQIAPCSLFSTLLVAMSRFVCCAALTWACFFLQERQRFLSGQIGPELVLEQAFQSFRAGAFVYACLGVA